jgi:hypothetical protein
MNFLLQRRLSLDHGFVLDKAYLLLELFFEYFVFPLSVTFYLCCQYSFQSKFCLYQKDKRIKFEDLQTK